MSFLDQARMPTGQREFSVDGTPLAPGMKIYRLRVQWGEVKALEVRTVKRIRTGVYGPTSASTDEGEPISYWGRHSWSLTADGARQKALEGAEAEAKRHAVDAAKWARAVKQLRRRVRR